MYLNVKAGIKKMSPLECAHQNFLFIEAVFNGLIQFVIKVKPIRLRVVAGVP